MSQLRLRLGLGVRVTSSVVPAKAGAIGGGGADFHHQQNPGWAGTIKRETQSASLPWRICARRQLSDNGGEDWRGISFRAR